MHDLPSLDKDLSSALRRYAESAVRPHDAMGLAHAARTATVTSHPILRGPRALAVAFGLGLLLAGLLAALAAVGQQPSPLLTFAPGSIAFTRDGNDDGGGPLYVADADGQGARLLAEVDATKGETIGEYSFSPDRHHLAYEGPNGLTIVGVDGGAVASLGRERGYSWGPDGQRLAVFSIGGRLSIVGLDGTQSMELPFTGVPDVSGAFRISWSPDGRWIAVAACDGIEYCKFDHDWLLVAADGSGSRWLDHGPSSGPTNAGNLDWGPDSRIVLAGMADPVHAMGPSAAVQVVSPDDGLLAVIDVPFWAADGASWAPDALRLLVEGRPTDDHPVSGLVVVDPAGGATVLPSDPIDVDGWSARWSGDGRRVLVHGTVGGSSGPPRSGAIPPHLGGLWSLDPAGGSPALLIEDVDPDWSAIASGS